MSDPDELRRQLLSLLVLDLGYDHQPPYGHAPLRHQFAWTMATSFFPAGFVDKAISQMKQYAKEEGNPFVDYITRDEQQLFERLQAAAHLDALREIALGYPPRHDMTPEEYAKQYLQLVTDIRAAHDK